jgi:hypothetical protein
MDLDDARTVIATQHHAVLATLRRDPRVWLCMLPDEFYGRWIQVSGSVRVVELPEAMDGLVDYYRRISGEHSNWDDYRAAMQRDARVLPQIELASAGPEREG